MGRSKWSSCLAMTHYCTIPIHILYALCLIAASPMGSALYIIQIGQTRIGYLGVCTNGASGCTWSQFTDGVGIEPRILALQKKGLRMGMFSIMASAIIFVVTYVGLIIRRGNDDAKRTMKTPCQHVLESGFWISAALGAAASLGTMEMGWALQGQSPEADVQIGMPVMVMQWLATALILLKGYFVFGNVGLGPKKATGGGMRSAGSKLMGSSAAGKPRPAGAKRPAPK